MLYILFIFYPLWKAQQRRDEKEFKKIIISIWELQYFLKIILYLPYNIFIYLFI